MGGLGLTGLHHIDGGVPLYDSEGNQIECCLADGLIPCVGVDSRTENCVATAATRRADSTERWLFRKRRDVAVQRIRRAGPVALLLSPQ